MTPRDDGIVHSARPWKSESKSIFLQLVHAIGRNTRCASNVGVDDDTMQSARQLEVQIRPAVAIATSRRRSESMYTAVGGVHLACPSHPHSQPSERAAPEPRTLLPPRKLGPDPPFGVSWQGFPHLTLVPERPRAPSGLVGSTASSASKATGRLGGSTGWRRASAPSELARPPFHQNLRRIPMVPGIH